MPGFNQYNIMINIYKITTTNLMAESDLCMVSGWKKKPHPLAVVAYAE